MELKRVEAVRYGALSDRVLGDLGPRLNLVVGRNEAGKSTMTSLIRHVLYGFPRRKGNERLYLTPGGDSRIGRLVFADGDSELALERVEGPHGGEAAVHGPHGQESGESLLEQLTAGVSAAVYRTVFGFSLEELSDLGSLAQIQSRLYATATGLEVNPHDALQQLRARAESVWAPRARTKELQKLNQDLRDNREARLKLADRADSYRDDREQLSAVVDELEQVDEVVRTLRHQQARLAALLTDARRFEERLEDDDNAASEHDRAVEKLREEARGLEVDEELLQHGDAIDRLAARLELFRSEAEQLRLDEEKLRSADEAVDRRLAELGGGWTAETVSGLDLDLELEEELHEQEEAYREARRRRDDSARQEVEARAELDVAKAAAEKLSEQITIADDERAVDVVNARLEAVDRLLILDRQMDRRAPSAFPGIAAAVVAIGLVMYGSVVDEPQVLWAAAPPAALAVAFFLWMALRRRLPAEIPELVGLLGLEERPSTTELVEIKSRLEEVRRAWLAVEAHDQAAETRHKTASIDEDVFGAAERAWKAWLEHHNLMVGSGAPMAAQRVLQTIRDLRAQLEARHDLASQTERRRESCDTFVADARALDAEIGDDRDRVAADVASLVNRLDAARRAADERRDLERRLELEEEGRDGARDRIEKNTARLREVLVTSNLGEDCSVADLEAAEAVAREELAAREGEREKLVEDRATLEGRLQTGVDESSSAELRLAASGIRERMVEALERYAVATVAARFLEQALESYEAERQPAVIRRAQELFEAFTDGRYTQLATPLGRFEPVVSGDHGLGMAPDLLSRATAEQLFLALRLSYIENLAGAHPALPVLMDDILVNFDRERRLAAIRVIAEFAEARQVVFFTCHSQTAEAFVAAAPDFTALELKG